MPTGEPYPSGTAYEVLSAIEARRKGQGREEAGHQQGQERGHQAAHETHAPGPAPCRIVEDEIGHAKRAAPR